MSARSDAVSAPATARAAGASSRRRHAVSVSLGSSTRDARIETELLGTPVLLERRGVDGDVAAAKRLVAELDGKVDAIGLGGTDLYVTVGTRRWSLRQAHAIAHHARSTPVVSGEGLKDTLERTVVERVDREIGLAGKRVLMLSGADRPGMAEALVASGADVTFGDVVFLLGLPLPLANLRALERVGIFVAPIAARLPITWLYPTGSKQESATHGWRERYFHDAEVIAGDFLLIPRYAPEDLAGKIILTNTTTPADRAMLAARGVHTLITTTPSYEGRSLPTNLLEAGLVAVAGKHPLSPGEYRGMLERMGLEGTIVELNG